MNVSSKTVLKNSFFNIAGQGLPSVAAIIVFPFIIRYLGQDRFGLLMLIFAIQGYLEFLNLRLGFALTKFASEAIYKREERRLSQLTWTTISYLIFLGAIGTIIIVILTAFNAFTIFKIPENLWFEARLSLIFTAVSLPLIFASTGWRALLAAGQRFDLINIIHAPISCLRYIIVLSLAAKGFYLPVIMLAILLTEALRLAIYFGVCLRLYPSIKDFSFDSQGSRSLLWFGGWLSVSQIVGMAIHYADSFIISGVLPIAELTYYRAPSEIVNRLGLISQSLNRAIFPALSTKARTKDTLNLYARVMKFLLIAATPLVLTMFLFSHDLLRLYLGSEIAKESYLVLRWLSLGFLVSTLGAIMHNYVLALGYPNKVAKFHLFELPLYVCTAIPLTVKFGIKGMAIAWFLSRIIETGYFFIVLKQALPESFSVLIWNGVNKALIAVIALSVFLVLTSFIFGEVLVGIKIIAYSLGIISYCIFSWLVVFTKEERVSLIKKYKNPFKELYVNKG